MVTSWNTLILFYSPTVQLQVSHKIFGWGWEECRYYVLVASGGFIVTKGQQLVTDNYKLTCTCTGYQTDSMDTD